MIFGPEKNDHKKLAIRKKSTILGFLPSNFNTQLAMPVRFQKKKLAKIGGHLPPKIKVQTGVQLAGTSGMYLILLVDLKETRDEFLILLMSSFIKHLLQF